ncbi:hypothetical protein C8A00DRAFT_32659 [Chaetomidium leptoderma]|uniref:Protein kinase domain-containing protein n=1 Tax=Chaetomidium leptoderma TaxID=669021 RepID=A0AAN6VNR3_9PEZI|nr:hypothetical protein C8A00DRAFT_32659 [Chaetomidium leptoderma]
MADPPSISAAIAGLLPVINEGFVLIRDVFVADRKSRFYLGRVELQRTVMYGWEETWVDPLGLPEKKLQRFAEVTPLLARGILQQLVFLLRTFTDPEKLKVRYGIAVEKVGKLQRLDDLAREMKRVSSYLYTIDSRFSTKDLAAFQEHRLRLLDFFRSIRYTVLGGDTEMGELIERLKEFNRNLQLFTTPETRDVVTRTIFQLVAKDVAKDIDRTKRLEEAANYEAKHAIDQGEKENYDDLAKFANFSMAMQGANPDMSRKKIFRIDDFAFDSPYHLDKNATLARLFDYPTKYQSRLVLVEWVTVKRGVSSTAILQTLDETKVTWYILHAVKPDKLLLPATIGLIFDESSPRSIGIVFQLPSHIRGNLPTRPVSGRAGQHGERVVRSPKAIAAQRMPTSLRQLILKQYPKGIDLGIRFKLAQQLLDAVHLMHTARFTHRNIRPDNIIFFPSSTGTHSDPDPSNLDYTNPLLLGFHGARLETTFSPSATDTAAPAPTWTQPAGLKPILKNAAHRIAHAPPSRDIVVIDCYMHRDWRLAAGTHAPYRRQYDLYSVGCVLLELGLWATLDNVCGQDIGRRAPLADAAANAAVKESAAGGVVVVAEKDVWKDAETVREAARGLDVITGSVYAEVTRTCLSLKPISGDVLDLERRLAATLAQIAA